MTTPQSSVPTARRSGNSGHFARGRGGGGTPSSGRWSAVAAAGSNGTGSGGHRSNSRGEPRGSFGKMSNRSDASHEQLVCLLAMLVGQMVVVTLQRGERYVGVLAAASTETGDLGLVLKMAQPLRGHDLGEIVFSLVISGSEIVEIDAAGARLSSAAELDAQQQTNKVPTGFRTDTEISAGAVHGDGRTLQRWVDQDAPDDTGGLADSLDRTTLNGSWDQFAANEERFGVTSNYEETMYTTKLDRSGKDFKERERQAEQLANEILSGSTSNVHVAEERNQTGNEMDEEARYGAVARSSVPKEPEAEVPPAELDATELTSSAEPPPSKALTADFRQFVSAERERLVVRKAELAKKEKQSRLADLKVWAQTFQLKTPVPADVAMLKRSVSSKAAASTSSSPSVTPAHPVESRSKVAGMTIPSIPTFKKPEEKKAPSRLSAKAATFNPHAASITPSAAARPKTSEPAHPFFGTRELKNRPGGSSTRLGEDFRPPKGKKLATAAQVTVWWPYTGRPFRQQIATSTNKSPEGAPMAVPAQPVVPLVASFPPGGSSPVAGMSPSQLPAGTASPHMAVRPSGKSPNMPPQQQLLVPASGSPHVGQQQPFPTFVYNPYGQYRFPGQPPYMPPDAQMPVGAQVAPMVYRAPMAYGQPVPPFPVQPGAPFVRPGKPQRTRSHRDKGAS